jgi:hypothetical protein
MFINNPKLFVHLEHIIKNVFYEPVLLSEASIDFIKYLLQSDDILFRKQGINALHCCALGLQDGKLVENITLFFDDRVLRVIMSTLKNKP